MFGDEFDQARLIDSVGFDEEVNAEFVYARQKMFVSSGLPGRRRRSLSMLR